MLVPMLPSWEAYVSAQWYIQQVMDVPIGYTDKLVITELIQYYNFCMDIERKREERKRAAENNH